MAWAGAWFRIPIIGRNAMAEVLIFDLAGHRFGITGRDVDEAVRAVLISALPQAPAIVEGVINLRGRIVPVLDIRARFGLPQKEPQPSDHLIIARANGRVIALRVDRATDFVQVPEEDIVQAIDTASFGTMVAGVAKLPDGLAVIHDLSAFLTSAEADALDAVSVPS